MSCYTIELRYLIEAGFELNLKKYPIFNEEYRETLNQLIIDHFYFREIGLETADRFNFKLGSRMQEIMPYYNLLYKALESDIMPLTNYYKSINLQTESSTSKEDEKITNIDEIINTDTSSNSSGTGQTTSTADTTNNTTTNNDRIYSDTPSAPLPSSLSSGYYTNRTIDTGNKQDKGNATGSTNSETSAEGTVNENKNRKYGGTEKGNENLTGNETKTGLESGYIGKSVGEMLREFKEGLFNINVMILSDLEILFMGVWPNE